MSSLNEIFTTQEIQTYFSHKIDYQSDWNFLRKIFDFCHKIRLNSTGLQPNYLTLQLMYLMDMASCLRIIQTATMLGYPHEAGRLCSSLWEMAHTVIYLSHKPEYAEKYIASTEDQKIKIPQGVFGKNWKEISMENTAHLCPNMPKEELVNRQKAEYNQYEKLCKIKHSHPTHVNKLKKLNQIDRALSYGPYNYHEQKIILMEPAREMLLAIRCIIIALNNASLKDEFCSLSNEWEILAQKDNLSHINIPKF